MQWTEVEPVLVATYRLLDDQDQIEGEDVATALGRQSDDASTARALKYLSESGYVVGYVGGSSDMLHTIRATERGLQMASGWPTEGSTLEQADAFLSAIDDSIADENTPDEDRGRLRQLRRAAQGAGKELLAEVIAKIAEHQAGQ